MVSIHYCICIRKLYNLTGSNISRGLLQICLQSCISYLFIGMHMDLQATNFEINYMEMDYNERCITRDI